MRLDSLPFDKTNYSLEDSHPTSTHLQNLRRNKTDKSSDTGTKANVEIKR